MDPADMDQADQAERLFELLLERPPEQRDAFLDDACADQSELRRELAAPLPYAEADPDFLAIPISNEVSRSWRSSSSLSTAGSCGRSPL